MRNLAKGKVGKPIDLSSLKLTEDKVQPALRKNLCPIPGHTYRQTLKINQQDMFKLNEIMLEKKTKRKLKTLLKKRGWSAKDIEDAMKELWPET